MSGKQVDVPVDVRAIMSTTKRDPLEVAFKYPPPWPVREVSQANIDPNYVAVQLAFQDKDNRGFAVNMLLSSDHAKTLNLMVGDKMTLRLIKEESNRVNVPIE